MAHSNGGKLVKLRTLMPTPEKKEDELETLKPSLVGAETFAEMAKKNVVGQPIEVETAGLLDASGDTAMLTPYARIKTSTSKGGAPAPESSPKTVAVDLETEDQEYPDDEQPRELWQGDGKSRARSDVGETVVPPVGGGVSVASNERVTTTPPADKQADVFPRAAAQAKGDEDRAIGNMLGKEETMTAAGQEEVVVVAAEKPAVDKAAVPTAKPVSHEQRVTLDKSPCSGATEKTEEKLVKVLDGIMSSKGKAGVLLKDFSEKLVQQAIAGIDDLGFDEGGEDCSAKTLISMGVRMGAAIGLAMGKHIEHRVSPNWADEMDQDLDEIKRTLRADVVASTENLASQAITKFLPLRTDLEEIKIVAKDARDLAQASVDENLRTCEALVSLDKTLKAHPQVAPLDADIIKLLEAELIDESKMVLKDAVKAVVKGHSLDRVLDIESNMKELGTKVQACMNMLTDQAHLGAFAPVEMDLADVPVTLRNVIVGLVQRGVKQDAAVAELQRRVQDQAAQVQQVQQARQANANANVDRVAGRVGKVEKTVDELGQMLSLYPTRDEVKATAEEEVREGAVLLAKNFAKTHTDAEAKLKEWVKQTFARRRT